MFSLPSRPAMEASMAIRPYPALRITGTTACSP